MQPSNILALLVAPFLGLTQAAALHPHAKSHIIVHLYGEYDKHYVERVWPDGDEHWFNEGKDKWKRDFPVKFIKYFSVYEDRDIRCLPTKSYYPWEPIKGKLFQLPDEDGYKVHGLYLEHSQPVEVLRCDRP